MNQFVVDSKHFTIGGAYYPKGHIFAMLPSEAAAHAVASDVAKLPQIGSVCVAAPHEITQAFEKRAAEVGGIPSVGREDQFMLRFVELAHLNEAGLLIEVADVNVPAVIDLLRAADARVAYHYRTFVIDELIEASPEAEAAASGRL